MSKHSTVVLERVFEARYERGYRYLDKCGDALAVLEEMLTADTGMVWMPAEMSPNGARLKCPEKDLSVVFDTEKLIVSQKPAEIEFSLHSIAQTVLAVITGRFDLKEFVRLGARRIHILPTDSIEEAQERAKKLSPVQDWPFTPDGGFALREAGVLSVYETEDRSRGYRVDMRAGFTVEAPEQVDPRLRLPPHLLPSGQREALIGQIYRSKQRRQSPVAGVIVDFDYYEVRPSKMSVTQFLTSADSLEQRTIQSVFERARP